MKILQIITLAECGGAQVHLLELINGLKEDCEFEVIVGQAGFLVDKLKEQNITVWIVPELIHSISLLKDLKAVCEIAQIIKKTKPNLVHCHSSKAGIVGRLAAWFCKTLCIFTAHGWAFHPKVKFLQRFIALLSESIVSFITSKIICVSEFDEKLATSTKLINKNKLVVIHNGISDLTSDLTKYELPVNIEDTVKILMVGRFAEPKRQDLLIKSFLELIKESNTKCSLLFAGTGPLEDSCRKLTNNESQINKEILQESRIEQPLATQVCINSTLKQPPPSGVPTSTSSVQRLTGALNASSLSLLGERCPKGGEGFTNADLKSHLAHTRFPYQFTNHNESQIIFLGEVKQIEALLNSVDILLLLSDREGLPMSIIEAMRAGLPIIASNVGGIPELVVNNQNGLLVTNTIAEVKGALQKLISNKELRHSLGKESRAQFEKEFEVSIMLKKLRDLYLKLV